MARKRCALTGEPIYTDSLIYRVQIPIRETRRRYREADYDTVTAPLKLHMHAEAGVGWFGAGLKLTTQWSAYLWATLRDLELADAVEAAVWWDNEYGVRRVRDALLLSLPTHAVDKALNAVLAVHREGMAPVEVAQLYGVSEDWLDRKINWCMRLAHRKASTPVRRAVFKPPQLASA